MANFVSRNLLICVVPAVIALFSVYWFRKKKRMKPDIFSVIHNDSFEGSKDELNSHKNLLNSPTECSSDFANTLSDASSIASPENSSQSHVSSPEDMSESIEEHNSLPNCVDNITSVGSCSLDKANILSVENFCVSKSVANVKNSETVNDSVVSEKVEFLFSDSQSKIDHGKSNTVQSTISGKLKFPDELKNIQTSNMSKSFETNSVESCNLSFFNIKCSTQEVQENICSASDDYCFYVEEQITQVDKGICIEPRNLGEYVPSPSGESEPSALTETYSNDSHSSVLDENSLSCVSEESESRQPIDFKSKGRSSSILDEYSLYDESEKTDVSGYGTALHSKADEIDISKNVCQNIEKAASSSLNVSVLNESNSIIQTKVLDNQVEMVVADDVNANENANIDLLTSGVKDVDVLSPSKLGDSHSTSDILQSDSIASVCTVKCSLDIFSNDKLLSCSDICENDRDLIQYGEVDDEIVIPACDKSNSGCVHLSEENSSDLATASLVNEGTIVSNSTDTADTDSNNLNETLVNEHKSVDSGVCSSADESLSSRDLETAEVNVSGYVNSISVPSNVRTSISISEANKIKTEISQLDVLSQNKVDSDLMDIKVPGDSSSHFVYEFDLPQELCGRLIGRQGKHVKSIKERTNANVFIKRHPYNSQLKTVVVEGNRSDVYDALEIIRRKYPLSQFPTVTLEQTNLISSHAMSLPDSLQLHLPDGVSCDVILSSLVSAGHFFLQQPTHPTYPSLSTLDQCMINCYSQMDTPLLPHPVEAGVICAAPVLRGWYRAQVIYVFENGNECEVKFVDYGGFSQVLTSSLRQIRSDFMTLPFQATECYLANVKPVDRTSWSAEATATFEELAQGQILQAYLVDIAEDGIPYVHLYKVQGISNMFINRELVERGFAVWVDNNHWDPH